MPRGAARGGFSELMRQADMKRSSLRLLQVKPAAGDPRRGWLVAGSMALPVALGRSGVKANKREGDGATPRGRFRLVRLWLRSDRGPRPRTLLPVRPIGTLDHWCEDPADRRYNRPVKLPAGAPGDRLWRDDHLYDFVIELDHNARPRVARRGSAVFIHVARPGLAPTAGCVALAHAQLRRLVSRLGPTTRIEIS